MSRSARWRPVLVVVALPLLFLPLRAAESPPAPPPVEQPEPPAAEATAQEETPGADRAEEPQEQVSADNNLSFPVDI